MKSKLLVIALLTTLHTATAGLLPTPMRDLLGEGVFTLSRSTTISYDASLAPLAQYMHQYLDIELDSTRTHNQSIVLRLDTGYDHEAYSLRILPSRIEIIASDYGGVFNGIQTLFQLLPAEVYNRQCPLPTKLTCRTIDDKPRFQYRGMMLDVARTWVEYDAVKRYIDLLSYHKINTLHLHLTDDEGWRIEIKSHPELAEVGGFRGGDSPVRSVYGKWNQKYGGYFTQDQLRELVAYAAVRNIEVIPEIDLPGHSRNIAQVWPHILCRYKPDTTRSNGYDERSAWCVAREANYALLADIIGEICNIFPSQYIHIGGDEVEVSQWKKCPDCQALMQRLGIDNAHLLQDHFMARLVKILDAHGKRPVVWNDAVKSGKFTHNSLVSGWESTKACLDVTEKGYRTVIMPAQYFYFDMRQTPNEDGHTWAAIIDMQKVYSFDFSQFTPSQMSNVAGLSATFFSETSVSHQPETPNYLDYMCYPRICALSEIAWHGNGKGWDNFYAQLQQSHYDRLSAMGVNFRLTSPTITYKDGQLTATTPDKEAEISYVVEGSSKITSYTRPITTNTPHRYLFQTHYKSGHSAQVGAEIYYKTITPALKLTTSMGESQRIRYTNVETYRTFARTARACRQADWIRYDFAQPMHCREIYLQTGHRQLPKTIITTGYVEISTDGVRFERAAELINGSVTLHPKTPLRALRIVSTCDDNGCAYVTIQPPQIKPIL